jgi:hypothetical protein
VEGRTGIEFLGDEQQMWDLTAKICMGHNRLATELQQTSHIDGQLLNQATIWFGSVSVFFWFTQPDF